MIIIEKTAPTLHWRHNEHDDVSNHQPHDCSLNRLFRRRSKKHQSSASLAFVSPVNSPRKGPVTRNMFPVSVIMQNVTEDSTVVASGPSFSVPVLCNDRHKTWAWTQRELLQFGVKSWSFVLNHLYILWSCLIQRWCPVQVASFHVQMCDMIWSLVIRAT